MQDVESFERFARIVEAVPFSQVEWREADVTHNDPIRRAVAFFIRCRQSLAGRQDTFAPLSKRRTRRGMNEQASAWWNAIDGLRLVHEWLRRVVILNRPALDVIRSEDGPQSLFYADPPYVPTTRAAPDTYAHEMSEVDHRDLLDVCET